MADKTTSRARAGVLAGTAVAALLAFPGIASAAVNSNVTGGALTVTSDAGDAIAITAVNGQVKVNGNDPGNGAANAANITSITVTGDAGANVIDLSGVTPTTYAGITGLNVTINGGGGGDTITGSEHADVLNGGDGDDRITPNDNPAPPHTVVRDDARGDAGNDTIVWNGGDDDDLNEGGPGLDTIQVNGATANETFTVNAVNGRVIFDRALPTPTPPGLFNIDAGTMEVLDLNMNAGDDNVTAGGGLDALGFKLDVDGGDGNDIIDGSDAGDLLSGGNGDDRITPDDNPAPPQTVVRDDARGDAGNDTIIWNGGDDDDLNEGGDGIDTIQVNGATANETFTVKPGPNGRVIFDRALPTPTPPGLFNIDAGTMEVLDLNMNAGDDTLTTDSGLGAFKIDAEGGDGNDIIDGGDAADLLQGGNNNDRIIPDDNPLNTRDVARGDAGDDTTVWNGGDDDDDNEGGDGNDTTEVNGATASETFTVKPSTTAGRVRFDRTSTNPAPFSIEIGTTERLLLNADDGDDKIRTDKGLAGLIAGEFNGGDGNDLVEGTDSPDRLNGDKGHDVILAKDKAEDLLDCGPGFDLARVDKRDFLRNCNIIIGHRLKVRVDAKKLAVVNGRAVMPLECAGTKKCKGVVKVRSGGKTLASGKFNIKKRSKTVHLKLNDKGRRLSALGKSVTVHIDAKDTKGNGWRTTQQLKLTR